MNILFANNYYYSRGGSEKVFFDEMALLKENNINVDSFSINDMNSIKNFGKTENFVDEPKNKFLRIYSKIENLFWNKEAEQKIKKLINKNKYDILHLHNIHSRLSHSITITAYNYGLKSVLTLHDYKYICPHYTMMYNSKICEDCENGKFYKAFINRCHKNSYIASGLVALESYNFKKLDIYNKISIFIAPSKFLLQKYKEMGFTGNIMYIPNFIDIKKPIEDNIYKNENFYIYVGRLSYEKGVMNLLEAFKNNNKKLILIGGGPLEIEIRNFLIKNKMNHRVTLTGHIDSKKVFEYIQKAKAVIIPSMWYENAPISILETLSYGKLIIASNIGGIPEMVHNGKNGFLFDYSDFNSINEAIIKIESLSDAEISSFKKYSYDLINTVFSKENHLKLLLNLYEKVLSK